MFELRVQLSSGIDQACQSQADGDHKQSMISACAQACKHQHTVEQAVYILSSLKRGTIADAVMLEPGAAAYVVMIKAAKQCSSTTVHAGGKELTCDFHEVGDA